MIGRRKLLSINFRRPAIVDVSYYVNFRRFDKADEN
jgi:hypothetical protein